MAAIQLIPSRAVLDYSIYRCYYPTAPRRVQIIPKTSTNITRYLYSRAPVRQVCLLLTNHLARFPVLIPFRFANFCHAFPVNRHTRNSPTQNKTLACWIVNLLLDVLFCSIPENLYLLFVFLSRPTGSPKYGTTRKNTQRYYTTKRLIRYIYFFLKYLSGPDALILEFDWLILHTWPVQLFTIRPTGRIFSRLWPPLPKFRS